MRGYYRRVSDATDSAIAPTVTIIKPTAPHNRKRDSTRRPRRSISRFVSTADHAQTPPAAASDSTIDKIVKAVVGTDTGMKITTSTASVKTAPRANPSKEYPSIACPRPGYSSERRNALSGSTSRRVSPRITAANGVPHTSQASRTIGFRVPQTGHGQKAPIGSSRSGCAVAAAAAPFATGAVSTTAGTVSGGCGGGSRRLVKHWPHHSASSLTRAPQFGQRRSGLMPGGYPRLGPRRRRSAGLGGLAQPRRQAAGDL